MARKNIIFKDENDQEFDIDMPDSLADENPLLPKPDLTDPQEWQNKADSEKTKKQDDQKADEETKEKAADSTEEEILAKAKRIRDASRQEEEPRQEEKKAAPVKDEQEDYRRAFAVSQTKLLNYEIKDTLSKIAKAEEEGEVEKKLEAERDLRKLEREQERWEATLSNLGDGTKKEPERAPEKTTTRTEEKPPMSEQASIWVARNEWFMSPKNTEEKAKSAAALVIYKDLIDKYKDPENPKIYQEVDKMLKEQFSGKPKSESKQPPMAGVGADSQSSSESSKGGRKRLEIDPQMRAIGNAVLAPLGVTLEDNPEWAGAYAKNIERSRGRYQSGN